MLASAYSCLKRGLEPKARWQLLVTLLLLVPIFFLCRCYNVGEWLIEWIVTLEHLQVDELLPTSLVGMVLLIFYAFMRVLDTHRELAARRMAEETANHRALHDALTGLPNRAQIVQSLHTLIEQVQAGTLRGVGVLFIDLDDFKAVNDTLGHAVGDELLQAVGGRLENCFRGDEDLFGRLGGDEFMALIPTAPNQTEAFYEDVASRVVTALNSPFKIGNEQILVHASVGIASAPRDGLTTAELLRHSDVALYVAKRQGRNRYALFRDPVASAAELQP